MKSMIRIGAVVAFMISVTGFYFSTRFSEESSQGEAHSSQAREFLPQDESIAVGNMPERAKGEGEGISGFAIVLQATNGNDLLDENLAQLFQDAINAKTPEDRALAFWVSSQCMGLKTLKDAVPLSDQDLISFHGFRPEHTKMVNERWEASRRQLQSFCSTGNSDAFVDSLLKLKTSGAPPLGLIMSRIDLVDTGDALRRQEYHQALTQVLASPAQYPAQFDRWLDSAAFNSVSENLGADRNLVWYVGESLMSRFGLTRLQNYRRLRGCISFYQCATVSELTAAQRSAVESAAAQIEQLMRTQQWDAFLPKGG